MTRENNLRRCVSTESSWDLGKRIRDWLALNPPGISEKGSDLN